MNETRKPLLPKKSLTLNLKDKILLINLYRTGKNIYFVGHNDSDMNPLIIQKVDSSNDIYEYIEKWNSIITKEKNNFYNNFIDNLSNYFKEETFWINPDFLPKPKKDFQNHLMNKPKNNNNNSFSDISILSLLNEDEFGNSILSKIDLIEPNSRFKNESDEMKCFIKKKGDVNETIFSINKNKNIYSNWEKGPNALNGGGAFSFIEKVFNFNEEETTNILKNILNNYDVEKIAFDSKYSNTVNFKNATPMPFPSFKTQDINTVINYVSDWRGLSKTTIKEAFSKNSIYHASLLRVPLNTQDKALKENNSGQTYSINTPKKSVKKDIFYFPLFDALTDEAVALQYISTNPNFNVKMNYGSTSGVYTGIKHDNANRFIFSEAAFDNLALYELMKIKKVDVKKYNFLSCQSVGGIETYLSKKFNVVFSEKNNNEYEIFYNDYNIISKPLNETQINQYKNELLGEGNKNFQNRKVVLVQEENNKPLNDKLSLINKAFKNISSNIEVLEIGNKNRFINAFQYNPLDIVLDSTSINTFLDRNNLIVNENGFFEKRYITDNLRAITNDDVKKLKNNHSIDSVISACDNDSAGHKISKKLALFADTFNLNFADWTPNSDVVKDYNDVLKAYKGLLNDSDIKNIPKNRLLSYIDERKLTNKKKLINKV